jgi:hypothetical protein
MKRIICLTASCAVVCTVHAIDDFNVQMSKNAQDDMSLRYDIYTTGERADLWESKSDWFQTPKVGVQFHATHQERYMGVTSSDLYRPVIDLSFQTAGKINVGLAYGHGFVTDEAVIFGGRRTFKLEGDMDSVGGYVGRQFDCGFKLGATWSHSTADLAFKGRDPFLDFETTGASGSIGYAHSFGEKRFGRNIFVDTSANFLYQSEEDAWYFLWMAKLGHSFCDAFSVYSIFNIYHEMDYKGRFGVPLAYAGYRPYGDETWGEVGGGFQARLCHGLSFTTEGTTPVMDSSFEACNAFQIRSGLNWSF